MRRLLMVCAVTGLSIGLSALAIAQRLSARNARANQQNAPEAYSKPISDTGGIKSDKAVVVVAIGIAPRGLAIDPHGNIFLTNASAPNRVFTLTGLADLGANGSANSAATARLAVVAGSGVAGSLGDGGTGLSAQFDLKLDSRVKRSGIAVAGDGTTFVADTLNSTVRRISGSDSSEPGIVRSIAGRWASKQNIELAEPLGIALDRVGNLYIADHSAGAIDFLPAATESAAGDEQAQVLAHVASPASIALTPDGSKVFVASTETGAIFEIDTQTRAIRSVGAFPPQKSQGGEVKLACASGSSQNGTAPVCPAGIIVDGGGNLFVADANAGSILRLDAKTSELTTAASGLRSPGEIRFDSSGNLYVAEQGANRIVKFVSMGQGTSNLTLGMPASLPPPPAPRICPAGPTGAFNFCDQPTGGMTATQAFTLTNNSGAAASGITISFTGANAGDFKAASDTCGTSSLAANGGSCAINVEFVPTATGSRSAVLSVSDSAGDTATANVTGTGDDFQLTLNGNPMEQSVVQGGTVKFNFNITPDAVFGGDVTIVCPSNIPALSTCTPSALTVTVTPGTKATFSVTFATTYNGILGEFPSNGLVPGISVPRGLDGPRGPAVIVGLVALVLIGFAEANARSSANRSGIAAVRINAMWIVALLAACAMASLGGCKKHSVPDALNTPAGETNLTIQGSAQSAGRGVTIILDVVTPG